MRAAALIFVGLLACGLARGAPAMPGNNGVTIRGQRQDVYYLPGEGPGGPAHRAVLFAPGDGGYRGFAVRIAERTASWGYDVYAIDTRRYLASFTGKTALKESEVTADFASLAAWIRQADPGARVTLMGWSEGAGLELLAAAGSENKLLYDGLLAVGLGEYSLLGWRTADAITWVTKKEPNEPTFPSLPYMHRVTPLPLVLIHSTGDEFTPVPAAERLFRQAREPKRWVLLDGRNHRFDGRQDEFFHSVRQGLQWIGETAR